MKVPVLMITFNRIEYTKKALQALKECANVIPYVVDNGSTDGTVEFLKQQDIPKVFFDKNLGIAAAMNCFLMLVKQYPIVGKVDNDTIVSNDWALKMYPYMKYADVIQSKHHIIPATCPGGWDEFTRSMVKENGLLFNHYVGGSGILFKRELIKEVPETTWKLGGWRKWQLQNPEVKKAFCESVEIKLLDEHGYTDYPEYYKTTGRC